MSNSSMHPNTDGEEEEVKNDVPMDPDDDFDDIELGERQPEAQEIGIK